MSEVTIRREAPRGMVTLRGDLSSDALRGICEEVAGVGVPGRRGVALDGARGAVWMSQDELLLLLPEGAAGAAVARIGSALAGAHHLAVDVSDARAVFAVEGGGAREVLAKLAPVDFSPEGFAPGMVRRTRLAQVSAAVWMTGPEAFTVICFASVAEYVERLLRVSAEAGPVGAFAG